MGNLLTSVFLGIVHSINILFIVPLVNAILALFPNLELYQEYYISFLELASTYLSTILRLLLFTRPMIALLFGYFFVKWGIWLASCAIRSVIKLYNLIKI